MPVEVISTGQVTKVIDGGGAVKEGLGFPYLPAGSHEIGAAVRVKFVRYTPPGREAPEDGHKGLSSQICAKLEMQSTSTEAHKHCAVDFNSGRLPGIPSMNQERSRKVDTGNAERSSW